MRAGQRRPTIRRLRELRWLELEAGEVIQRAAPFTV
jgi:hypothetical protein